MRMSEQLKRCYVGVYVTISNDNKKFVSGFINNLNSALITYFCLVAKNIIVGCIPMSKSEREDLKKDKDIYKKFATKQGDNDKKDIKRKRRMLVTYKEELSNLLTINVKEHFNEDVKPSVPLVDLLPSTKKD
jgi:site-specific DNA-adenine methylase